jgi:hypothetical protein
MGQQPKAADRLEWENLVLLRKQARDCLFIDQSADVAAY